jgi:hypothetical protein
MTSVAGNLPVTCFILSGFANPFIVGGRVAGSGLFVEGDCKSERTGDRRYTSCKKN